MAISVRAARTDRRHKAVLIGAVVGTALIGGLRYPADASASASTPKRHAVHETAAAPVADDGDTDAVDALRLVPAIYARDPDMRFVYYRNVSKWM